LLREDLAITRIPAVITRIVFTFIQNDLSIFKVRGPLIGVWWDGLP